MQDHGYRIIPVNPNLPGNPRAQSVSALAEIAEPVDIVDCFRKVAKWNSSPRSGGDPRPRAVDATRRDQH
jgi:predicted CoA-binding protein